MVLAVSCSASPELHLQVQVWLLLFAKGLPPPGCSSNSLFWADRGDRAAGNQLPTTINKVQHEWGVTFAISRITPGCRVRIIWLKVIRLLVVVGLIRGPEPLQAKPSQVTSFTAAERRFPKMRWEFPFTLFGHMKLMKRMTGSPMVKT